MKDRVNQDKTLRNGYDRKMLTLFLIMFPSILIAGDYGSFLANATVKAALIFYQFVLLKAFLESYYKLID